MMKKLNRMLLRDIFKSKAQFLAAAAVIFSGVCIFIASGTSYKNLKNSVDYYYSQYRFFDYYAQTASPSVLPEIVSEVAKVAGVKTAMSRLSIDFNVDMGSDNRVVLRAISIPDTGRPAINDINLIKGSFPESSGDTVQGLISQKFAESNKLKPGDSINIFVGAKKYSLEIKGFANSPEFIYALRKPGDMLPSNDEFGIVFIKESQFRQLTGIKAGYNQVHVIFDNTADTKAVIGNIKKTLFNSGYIGGFERKTYPSHVMISDDINTLKDVATIIPFLFLGVAAAIIYIMQRRIINNQRTIIGTMKALGYSNFRILKHYIFYSLLISVTGIIPGIIAGVYLGGLLTKMYSVFYTLSETNIKYYWDLMLESGLLSMALCILGSLGAAKRVLKLIPAQAMRPESPAAGKRILLERFKHVWKSLPFGWKVSIRNIFRNRQRALITAAGFAITITLVLTMLSIIDTMNYMLESHFDRFMKYDFKVTYENPATFDEIKQLEKDNIKDIRIISEMPAELEYEGKKKETLLVLADKSNKLYGLSDSDGNSIAVPGKGMLIAESLAHRLSLQAGDYVEVNIYTGKEVIRKSIKVDGLIKQLIGFNCYLSYDQLFSEQQFTREISTTALLKAKDGRVDYLKKDLVLNKNIEDIEDKSKLLGVFKSTMGLMYIFIGIMLTFSMVMGFGIIFNTTIINLAERKRELASLKVLGYKQSEIGRTLLRENILLGLLSLIPGIIAGRYLSMGLLSQMNKEVMTLEVYIGPWSYAATCICILVFILLAQAANNRNVKRLDMVEVLKAQE